MIGVGLDAVEIDRFRQVLVRRPSILERLFSADEREASLRRSDPVPSFAARFAAKEAAMKALGVGVGAVSWQDVEVLRAESGAPSLRTSGRLQRRAEALGVTRLHVSLSHTDHSAHAIVVAE